MTTDSLHASSAGEKSKLVDAVADPLCSYIAASASCDGPPLPSFVRFNDSHLPSAFPRVFLAAHAAFCVKDGEAPQVPDYLVSGRSDRLGAAASPFLKSNASEPLTSHVDVSTSSESNNGPNPTADAQIPTPKPLQQKALRCTVAFLRQQNFDFSSAPSILMGAGVTMDDYADSTLGGRANSDAEKIKVAARPQAALAEGGSIPSNKPEYDAASSAPGGTSQPPYTPSVAVNDAALGPANGATDPQTCNSESAKQGSNPDLGNPLLEVAEEEQRKPETISASNEREVPIESSACKKRKGLNTAAMRHKNLEQVSNECAGSVLCLSQAACGACDIPNCTKEHDVAAFMKTRPEDLTGECIFFLRFGMCPYGCCCRFGLPHLNAEGVNMHREGRPVTLLDLKKYKEEHKSDEVNILTTHSAVSLAPRRKRHYGKNKQAADGAEPSASSPLSSSTLNHEASDPSTVKDEGAEGGPGYCDADADAATGDDAAAAPTAVSRAGRVGAVDTSCIDDTSPEDRRRKFAKHIRGKTFLAPLTTVGNLPFRRLCTRLGADVTVSEMAVAQSLVEGKASELCLLRRHREEKTFGIQIAAGFPDVASECGKLIKDNNIQCDFIDLNIACPLDQLHRKFKAGSCMLEKPAAVESVVKSLMDVSPDIPVTLKVRTAHYGKKHQLHNVIGRLSRCGVSAIFAHGRTAQQRYSKSADWEYLSSCKQHMAEDVLLVGCGDILSSAEYQYRESVAGMDALMIGRGALIKPWIFTEIKERRIWDISAPERFELLKEFVNNGLEHWGSDRRGIATTRRFLLELLSFTHRYIPPPFLELEPQLIQWRPSPFKGRSDLEVKLSSPNTQDWVEISSMFLGPPPKGFTFVPKHASNAYYVAR